ncbi:MAG: DUF3863 domain-containing protein [Planctomycetes bacterium]|nr:DUF3863 domain-containing protein [Planctomycetota bacterium]
MRRRDFLRGAAGAVLLNAADPACAYRDPAEEPTGPTDALAGRRILTFNSVIRVNQIEVTRTRNEGFDEYDRHTPENVRALRQALADGWPGAPMTWAFSWRALHDERERYAILRELAQEFHDRYGDDVTFIPGAFFANAYNTREQVDRDLHDGLARVSAIMGGGFRPKSVIAGFLAADNQRYLAEVEGIHVCQGNIWSQYAVDNQDGEGSICYPYYPSAEHFCKPAQSARDLVDCVNLDGWTMDFLAARRPGGEETWRARKYSRMGVGPIETIGRFGPEVGLQQMLATTAVHFDTGFELNRWAWVTNCWEISLVPQVGHLEILTAWTRAIRERWPAAECLLLGDFGEAWRRAHRSNDGLDYRFRQRGTGIGGSDAELEIRWFMNERFRLALLRNWQLDQPERVIDFTRYDLAAAEPREPGRNWSLMNRLNQKGIRPQDRPTPLSELPDEDRRIILDRYPELG